MTAFRFGYVVMPDHVHRLLSEPELATYNNLYTGLKMKLIEFCGDSLATLRQFPETARRRAGHQLDRVQHGLDPIDWKPMNTIGPGVREIRIKDEQGIFRVLYVTRFAETVYVLHCFQKKTQKTSQADLDKATQRYKELQKEQSR